jgi:TRAP-type mannitol/chloroaromatic compound transport system permease small subunit
MKSLGTILAVLATIAFTIYVGVPIVIHHWHVVNDFWWK